MATPQLSALLAERLAGYRSAFELSCAGLFGGGASVTLEYEDDDDEGAARSSPGLVVTPPASASADDSADTLKDKSTPDAADVKRDVEAALRQISTDFAQTFNNRLAELAQADPIAQAVAPRYEFGPQHIADVSEALFDAASPLLMKLDSADLDGARRASVDVWLPLERRIREKWQCYFVFTFQDLSVELRAQRDRKRTKSSLVDKAAIEALATPQLARAPMSDFGAPSTWDRSAAGSTLSPWLAVVALLVVAAAGGWLLAHSFGHHAASTTSSPR